MQTKKITHLSFTAVEIQKYLEYINTLKYQQEPDYDLIRKLFKDGLKKRGGTDDGKNVKFTTGKVSSPLSSSAAADLCNGYSSEETETRDNAARQRPAARVRLKKYTVIRKAKPLDVETTVCKQMSFSEQSTLSSLTMMTSVYLH